MLVPAAFLLWLYLGIFLCCLLFLIRRLLLVRARASQAVLGNSHGLHGYSCIPIFVDVLFLAVYQIRLCWDILEPPPLLSCVIVGLALFAV